ncbi:MAG: hypothetical protein R3D25_13845 [Geminicoccaceae bacterium]
MPAGEAGYSRAEVEGDAAHRRRDLRPLGVSDADAGGDPRRHLGEDLRRWREGEYGRVNRDLADRLSYVISTAPSGSSCRAGAGLWLDGSTQRRCSAHPTPVQLLLRGGMEDLRAAPLPDLGAGRR